MPSGVLTDAELEAKVWQLGIAACLVVKDTSAQAFTEISFQEVDELLADLNDHGSGQLEQGLDNAEMEAAPDNVNTNLAQFSNLSGQLAAAEARIMEQQALITGQQTHITAHRVPITAQFTEQQAQITEQQKQIKELRLQITEQQAQITDQYAQIATLNLQLHEKSELISSLTSQVKGKSSTV